MSQPSLLVVDDELLIRDLLYDFFTDQGWSIAVAENGEKALEILKNRRIDLVLSDIKMPEMDGLELAARVREMHPAIPVVMTGYPSVDTAVAALRSKAADYIVKPFNIHQLYKKLDEQLHDQKSPT